MGLQNAVIQAFNRGLVSRLGLARTDIKRTAMAAEVMTNWIARVLGSMMLRPGTQFLGDTNADLQAKYLDFVFRNNDTALIELTNLILRIWVNDALVTRVAVGSQTVNGTFAASLASWTSLDAGGAVSDWVNAGDVRFIGDGVNSAGREQQVVVAAGDIGKEHALRIIVSGSVAGQTTSAASLTLRVGSASGQDDYVNRTDLSTGTHSIAFTPAGNFWVRFTNTSLNQVHLASCVVEGAGVMTLPTPWASADLGNVRKDQSLDLVFVGCDGHQQKTIERRGVHSWSITTYAPNDGPFLTENVSGITITPGALGPGQVQLNASESIFNNGHLGALFRVTSIGQSVIRGIAAANVFTNSIRISGVSDGLFGQIPLIAFPGQPLQQFFGTGGPPPTGPRRFIYTLSGTFTGIVTLQQSMDNATWTDFLQHAGPVNVISFALSIDDGLSNQIIYYRAGFKAGDYTSGQVNITLQYANGSRVGVGRVIDVLSDTAVLVDAIQAFGGTTATNIWAEGSWSTFRGFPTSVSLHQGRLWWFGQGKEFGSVSDGFFSFDDTVIGDAGPIQRSIGSGPLDNINWALSLQRLLLGADLSEYETITSSLDEPITPTNFTLRPASTHGSAKVQAVKVDATAVFARRAGTRVLQLAIDPYIGDYAPQDLTALVPELFDSRLAPVVDISIQRMAVQRLPDTRVHFVRADGAVGILIFDRVENVICWVLLETPGAGGFVEDVVVLPNTPEDAVYYCVRRTIGGVTKRFLERWALEAEGRGAAITKLSDACVLYNGAPATSIAVAHLIGQSVTVWADGKDVGTDANGNQIYTVDNTGHITLALAASIVVVGLPYAAQWQSAKLAYGAQMGTALTQPKRIPGLGVIMADTHAQGLKYGKDFTNLDPLPTTEDIVPVDPDKIWDEYDKPVFAFDGDWDTDARVCLQAASPRCCTLLGLVIPVDTEETVGS